MHCIQYTVCHKGSHRGVAWLAFFAEVVLVCSLQPGSVSSTQLWFVIDVFLFCSPQIERRMELVRAVSHNTHKRLVSCLQGQVGTDDEKRSQMYFLHLTLSGTYCFLTTL